MKHIKMVLYGEPGVGKSVFASKFPKPFFICTDGNYEWLEDFGAKPEDHVIVDSWSKAKEIFNQNFDDYDTIVVDLLEDLFKWCEYEFCTKNNIEHLADLGYGKGYDITRNEFFIEVCKLLAREKNIILIVHGTNWTVKDRRGVEHTKFGPTGRIPDKVIDMIEGRVRYFLRCYVKDEEQPDGTVIKNRYLSLVPKANEFGIIRGVDENKIPQDIRLEFSEFAKAIGFNSNNVEETEESEPAPEPEKKRRGRKPKVEEPVEEQVEEKTEESFETVTEVIQETVEEIKPDEIVEEPTIDFPTTETIEVVKPVVEEKPVEEPRPMTNDEKLAAIKAKLAAMKR